MSSRKKIIKESFKPYCGFEDVPKGHRKGTMKECVEKKQIRLFGLHKIDPKTVKNFRLKLKQGKVLPETREKLLLLLANLKGRRRTISVRAEKTKDKLVSQQYKDELKNVESRISHIIPKLQKIENSKKKAISNLSKDIQKLIQKEYKNTSLISKNIQKDKKIIASLTKKRKLSVPIAALNKRKKSVSFGTNDIKLIDKIYDDSNVANYFQTSNEFNQSFKEAQNEKNQLYDELISLKKQKEKQYRSVSKAISEKEEQLERLESRSKSSNATTRQQYKKILSLLIKKAQTIERELEDIDNGLEKLNY